MKQYKYLLTLGIACLLMPRHSCAASIGGPGTYLGNGNDIMMEGFTWSSVTPTAPSTAYWNVLASQVTTVAAANVTMLWLPPSAASVDYQGYIPNDWYNQANQYGSYTQLKALLSSITANNMRPLADIVMQHRSGDTGALTDFARPLWTDICTVITCQSIAQDGYTCASCTNGTGSTNASSPNLNMASTQVQTDCENYMNWMLTSMGYSAFRMDEANGYGPSYVGQYLSAAPPYFAVAEYLDGDLGDCQTYLSSEGSSATLYDFPLMYTMNTCVTDENYSAMNNGGGQLPGLVGQSPANAVTFLSDQDTEPPGSLSGDAGTPWPSGKELEGYAIILMAPGTPDIFYGHYFGTIPIATSGGALPTAAQISQEQSLINALTQIRKNMGINSKSVINIRVAENQLYAAVIDNKVCVEVGPNNGNAWEPSDDSFANSLGTWNLATSGCCNNYYAVWTLNGAPALTHTPTSTPTPACSYAVARIACGRATPYTDTSGNVWSADYGFLSGTAAGGVAVTGTNNPILYETSRYGNPIEYSFNVPNGNYEVEFLLSESLWSSEGLRVFNIELNGTTVSAGVDPWAIGGADAAVNLTLTTTVTTGTLTISAAGIQDLSSANASINAIQITLLGSAPCWTPTPTPTFTPSATRTATTTPSYSASPSSSPSSSPSPTLTLSPTASPSATQTQSPTSTSTPSKTPSLTPTMTATLSPQLTATPSATVSVTSTATPSPTASATNTPSNSPTPSPSITETSTVTPSFTVSGTSTPSFSPTPSRTVTSTLTLTPSSTVSDTSTPSSSPTPSRTATQTLSPSLSPSNTASVTTTWTITPSFTASDTATLTTTYSPSPTGSSTPSVTTTLTPTPTLTQSATFTETSQATITPTWTPTVHVTPSPDASPTPNPNMPSQGGGSGGGKIITYLPALNPQAGPNYRFAVELSAPASTLTLRIYSRAMVAIQQTSVPGNWHTGWNSVTLPISSLSNGLYFVLIHSDAEGGFAHKPTFLMVIN